MPYTVKKVKNAVPKNITCGILRNLTTKEDFKEVDFCHVTVNNKTQKHYHKKITECYYVLKGAVDIEIDGAVEHLKEGNLIMIYPNTLHKAIRTSKEPVEILVICSPPWTEEDEILAE